MSESIVGCFMWWGWFGGNLGFFFGGVDKNGEDYNVRVGSNGWNVYILF